MARIEDNINIDATVTLAGFLGAIVSLKYAKNASTLATGLAVLGGTFTSMFATPFIAEHIPMLQNEPGKNFTAFLVGLFGLNFVAWIYDYLAKNGWQGLVDAVTRKKK
jgi:hypothetical protein